MKMPSLSDYALLFFLSTIWGSAFVFTTIAVRDIPPATQTSFRLLGSAFILWVLFAIYSRYIPKGIKVHFLIFLSGLLGTAIPFLLISWGQVVVAPGLTAVLMAVMPLATLGIAHFFTRDEKFSLNKFSGVVLGITGVAILVGPSVLSGIGTDFWRQGAILLAACCYAANAVVTKFLLDVPKVTLLTLSISYGLLPVSIFSYYKEGAIHLDYGFSALGSVALLAAFHTVFASFLFIILIKRQGASFLSQINLLIPLFGVFWAYIFFQEKPSIHVAFALIVILSGILVARGRSFKTKEVAHVK